MTVPDLGSWYESTLNIVYKVYKAVPTRLQKLIRALQLPVSTHSQPIVRIFQLANRVWQQDFQGKFEQKDFAIAFFNRHIEQVKQIAPAERRLVYQVKEG